MKRSEFRDFVEGRFQNILKLLDEKGKEYANLEDAFHNFNEGCNIATSGNRLKYAWDLRAKHLQSIKDMFDEARNGAKIEEKCGDDILYGLIIWAMFTEELK